MLVLQVAEDMQSGRYAVCDVFERFAAASSPLGDDTSPFFCAYCHLPGTTVATTSVHTVTGDVEVAFQLKACSPVCVCFYLVI